MNTGVLTVTTHKNSETFKKKKKKKENLNTKFQKKIRERRGLKK